MTADEIRRCVTIANGLKADLVALTGDYIADDPAAQGEVVRALAGLRAPYGVFGCLGNHEIYTETEDSITRLFAAEGIRILRQERAPIQSHGEMLNLIGIDYQSGRFSKDHPGHLVDRYLERTEKLVMPDMVNILLSHNPNVFDRAAQLGIDLTLAGHTHGGTSEPLAPQSAWAPGRRLRCLNWCEESDMREVLELSNLTRRTRGAKRSYVIPMPRLTYSCPPGFSYHPLT